MMDGTDVEWEEFDRDGEWMQGMGECTRKLVVRDRWSERKLEFAGKRIPKGKQWQGKTKVKCKEAMKCSLIVPLFNILVEVSGVARKILILNN